MTNIANTTNAIWEAIQRVSPAVTRDEIAGLLSAAADADEEDFFDDGLPELLSPSVGGIDRSANPWWHGVTVPGVELHPVRDAKITMSKGALALRRDETLDIALAAAQASTSEIPAIVTGLDVLMMGAAEYEKIRKSGHWVSLYNQDAMINLEHPDVRRALEGQADG